jgi:ribonuclease P protein component
VSHFVTLKLNGDFRRLYNRGRAVTNPALVMYYSKNRAGICRIGITTGKKIGNAVERNRSRRIIREAFRSVVKDVNESYDFVFVARSKTKYLKSTYIEKVMRDMMLTSGIIAENVKEEKDERTSS